MNPTRSQSAFDAVESPMDQLVKLSRHFGSKTEFVIAGGGNTSFKNGEKLFIKASGTSLAHVEAEGFVEMERSALAELLQQDLGSQPDVREERFKNAILAARIHPDKGQRPSVECILHNLLPRSFVVHTHSTLVNMINCCTEGERLSSDLFGDETIWVPYVDPGFTLARTLKTLLLGYAARTGRDCPRAVLMQNHGLIVCGDTMEEVVGHTDWIIERIKRHLDKVEEAAPFGEVRMFSPGRARALINTLAPMLRGLLAGSEALKVVTFDDSGVVRELVGAVHGRPVALAGPLTPDQIVYCNSFPLWFDVMETEDEAATLGRLRAAVEDHKLTTGAPPLVVLVPQLGMFASGDDFAQADTVRLVYRDAIQVMAGACRLGSIRYLPARERQFIEQWEVEAYRRKVAAGAARRGRAAGKVAVVTGAAQGFGLEIARNLVAEGAHAAMADINTTGVTSEAGQLAARWGNGRAIGISLDVTGGDSVAAAIHEAVRAYGGFDLLISNAGVLRAGSVKSQPEAEFDLVTSVNYKGYFLCVQNAAPILSRQRKARQDYWSDIIQINSKSGLVGSNRNGAYAGGKFGGIGLTQSFALELVEDGIKVNAVCPGNFFDGPLWSDPDTGLFVQYLRTGKVPGARSIEDVRRFYEAKVPMKRGCTAADVMKAIFYLIEQKYETGQAVPVTGGQVMLS